MSKGSDAEGRPLRTIFVRPFEGEMIKAGEIIEIVGHMQQHILRRRKRADGAEAAACIDAVPPACHRLP